MKRRMMSLLAAAMMLTTAIVPASYAFAEEDLVLSVPGNEQVMDKTDEESVLDEMNSANESILGALGKKDWEALAKSVEKTGDWREDLVAIAQSQVGYTEESDGTTIYADWAGYENGANWTALFVNWVANKAGLTTKQFPSGDSYASLVNAMRKVNAVKTISRSNYPVSGDLALIKANGQELVAFVVYVSNGYASVIHGDDKGEVTRVTYRVSSSNFSTYIDLNELMERAGVEVGKGGKVPVIPAEGIAAWTNTNAVYMRSEASTASKRVTTLKRSNTAVLVTDAEMGDDGYIWYAVKYSRYTGYIRSDLLKLDQEALSAAQPTAAPTATPTAAPTAEPTAEPTAIPGCVLCAQEANGAELPVECCYAQLKGMTAQESYEFMSKLLAEDYVTFVLYVNCHNAHVYEGSNDAVICYTGCEESIFAPVAPGAAHSVNCGWYIEAAATEAPAVTVVPTAAPTVVPAVTPAPTAAPTAEPTEAPTAEPTAEPTTAPTEAPVAPSACSLCAAESEYWGVALPANGCVYDYLSGMTANEAYEVLNDLDWNNYSGYRMYLDCHNDHVLAGEAAVICYGDVCGAGTWTQPGDAHAAGCPWYAEAGLSVQERVVDVTVVQGSDSVQIKFDIAGATAYQWYQVGPKADGTDDIAVTNAMTDTLTVQTSTSSKSFYCVATMPGNFQVKSKLTVVDVATSPLVAEAIVGEVVNFTYNCTGAVRYQWYDMENMPLAGATSNVLTLIADPAALNTTYYCVAWDANDNEIGKSNYYSYTIKNVAELTDEDLCKYVDELALLSRSARLDLMALWGADLTEKVREHWKTAHSHAVNYADLLCICGLDTTGGQHAYNCPWWDISSCGTTSSEPDVLGWVITLTAFADKRAEERSGWTFQWWNDVSNQAIQGETSNTMDVTYTLAEQRFYCVATVDGLQYRSDTYVVPAAQTDNYDKYIGTLGYYYFDLAEDDDEYYQMMHNAMTDTWNIVLANDKNLAVEVLKYWSAYKGENDDWLLCSCCIDEAGSVSSQIVLPPHSKHGKDCPWHKTAEEERQEQVTEREQVEPGFAAWAETASEAMIDRALKVKSLDHVAFEANDDGTGYNVYVVRYEEPVGTVDNAGFLYYGTPARVIAWVNFETQKVYPIYALPEGITPPDAQ